MEDKVYDLKKEEKKANILIYGFTLLGSICFAEAINFAYKLGIFRTCRMVEDGMIEVVDEEEDSSDNA